MTDVYIIKLPSFWFTEAIIQDLITIASIWFISMVFEFLVQLLMKWTNRRIGYYDPHSIGPKPRKWIRSIMFAPGVIIHELSHTLILLLTGNKIRRIRLFYDNEEDGMGGLVEPEGEVKGFMVTFLVAFAPLLVGSTIVTYIYRYSETIEITMGTFLFLLWIVVSIVVSCGPSGADLNQIRVSVQSSWEKLIRDIVLFGFAVFVYALIGDYSPLFLGQIPLIHFLFILLVQTILYFLSCMIVWIIRRITLDLGTAKLYAPSTPVKTITRRRRHRNTRHVPISSMDSYNIEYRKKRYSEK